MGEGVQTEPQTERREETGQPEGDASSRHYVGDDGSILEWPQARKEKENLPVSPQGQQTYHKDDEKDSERLLPSLG